MSIWSTIWPKKGEDVSSLFTWLDRLSRVCAAIGGTVILGVASVVTISVITRNLGFQGIRGDFELVEMSCAFASGLFLPLCQLNKNHVMVDLFTSWLPDHANAWSDSMWALFFSVGWFVLCYFTYHGMIEIMVYGDKSMLLGLPIWWGFVPAIIGSFLSGIIAFTEVFLLRGDEVSPVE